jgi:broad specificity phosphatase PhoE
MEVVLVRHGEPEWVRGGKSVGEPCLTARGRKQAELVAERLTGEQFDQVLVSPVLRAQETAEPILAALDAEPIVHPWLAEIRNPEWDGAPVEHVEKAFAEQRLRPFAELWDGLPGGETFHDFHDRVTRNLDAHLFGLGVRVWNEDPRLYQIDEPELRLLVVAHGGVNAVTVGALLGIPPVPWEWERFFGYHAGVTYLESVEIGGGRAFMLRRLSDLSHLPEELHTF